MLCLRGGPRSVGGSCGAGPCQGVANTVPEAVALFCGSHGACLWVVSEWPEEEGIVSGGFGKVFAVYSCCVH